MKTLLETIRQVINMPDVQPGYPDANGNRNTTWCNRAAERILRMMGYDTTILYNRFDPKTKQVYGRFDKKGVPHMGYTGANAMAKNAAEAAKRGLIEEVSPERAQELANEGIPVLAAQDRSPRIGHVGVVAPSDKPYDSAAGPMIGQAGTRNRIDTARNSFGTRYPVHYYVLRKKG